MPDRIEAASDGSAVYEDAHAICVRVSAGGVVQSGFWVAVSTIVTCAHGFPGYEGGDPVEVEWLGESTPGEVLLTDRTNDILLVETRHRAIRKLLPLSKDVLPTDVLYLWGYTSRFPDGESTTVEMEGWSRNPYLLKVKAGVIESGMSGAPLVSITKGTVVGMVKATRDRDAPTGGRAVPASTILEVCALGGVGPETTSRPEVATKEDLPIVLGMFEAAYEVTRPRVPVDRSLLEEEGENWPEREEMLFALRQLERHNEARRDAIRCWFRINPKCIRFVVTDDGRRVGATCVLPLRHASYGSYRAGRVREFDLAERDIVPTQDGGRSSWLCFQSFGLASRGTRQAHSALRRSIADHVLAITASDRLPRVIAEVGTRAGLREARHFGMAFSGLSADGRPLFEIDIAARGASSTEVLGSLAVQPYEGEE